jgi:uncharacterized protein YjdB
MNTKKWLATLLAVPLMLSLPSFPQADAATTDPFQKTLEGMFTNIETEYRPDVRWWLAEGLNTDATLRENVQQIYDLGFGAAEFLAMPEPGAPDNIYGWGSDEWTADSRLVMEEATKLGLGFSLTSGTHWSHANLPDTFTYNGEAFDLDSKYSSKSLDYATVTLSAGQTFNGTLPLPYYAPATGTVPNPSVFTLQGVVAAKVITPRSGAGGAQYAEGSGTGELDFASVTDLTAQATGSGNSYTLNWTAPSDGDYVLLTYWLCGTGQTGEPSVSINYTINYIDSYGVEALKSYWQQNILTPDLLTLLQENGRGEIYMDSLELNSPGAAAILWGYNFKNEFQTRRGYDITPYLPFISRGGRWTSAYSYDYTAPGMDDTLDKVKNDLWRTLTDMYLDNVLKPLQTWLHSLGMTLRAEPSYGKEFEISQPAAAIDGIETESFAQNADIDLYRGILGSANMYGRNFSSETGAAFSHNYLYTMDDFTQLVYTQFVGGVNRTVFHGYSGIEGSDADTYWPGHEGMYAMFSERFNERQPASTMYPGWTEMIGRNQKALRQGTAQRDIAILRTDNNFFAYSFDSGHNSFQTANAQYDMPYFWQDLSLQHAGYTYDYFSPLLLEDTANAKWSGGLLQPDGPAYQAVIIYQEAIELSAAKKVLEMAQSGVPVIFVNNVTEKTGASKTYSYGQAASKSKYLSDTDADVQAVVAQIKALPNVKTIDQQSNTLATLKSMGVQPRVAYGQSTNQLMTISRIDRDKGIRYTFAYAFKYMVNAGDPAATYQLSLAGASKPYLIDDWTGKITPVGAYTVANERTNMSVTLAPGEAVLIAQNLNDTGAALHAVSTTADEVLIAGSDVSVKATASGTYSTKLSDGRTVSTQVSVPSAITLPTWNISLQDWNAGEKMTNTETKFGHTTTEVYYTTKKTSLYFNNQTLVPWKNLPATAAQLSSLKNTTSMDQVSGVGTYTATFTLPAGWSDVSGAYLTFGSTNGGTAEVWVNGKAAGGVDTRSLKIDISGMLISGTNKVVVKVASTLTNRLLSQTFPSATGIYPGWGLATTTLAGSVPTAYDYGLIGPVQVVPYVVKAIPPVPTPTPKVTVKVPVKPAPTYVTKVKFGQSKVTLAKGKSVTIRPGVYFTKGAATYTSRVTYKSSNPKVAKVDAYGNVKALKAGTAKITATSKLTAKNGKKLSATYTVTVVKKGTKTKVSKLTLPGVPKTLKVGQTLWLTATYTAKGNAQPVKVTYTSLKSGIAGIDAVGKLTGVSKGKDTIVVKAGGKTTKYTITVK